MGQTNLVRLDYAEVHMGVRTTISLYASSREEGEAAARAAFDRMAALEDVASDYRPASEVRRLAASFHRRPIPVSPDLWRLILASQRTSEASGGAFDITAGPYVALWREARKTGRLPAWSRYREARPQVGWQLLRLDPARRTVEGLAPGLQLDLGGIAKGDALDQARLVLRQKGIKSALIQMGGDMAASGPPPGQRGWRIQAPSHPAGEIWLKNQALSTSGDTEQHVDIGGQRLSHIIDPGTGFGVTSRVEATVLASSGLKTDPLATAFCVLGPEEGARLAKSQGVSAWFRVAAPD